MKKALVTGGTGYLGNHVIEALRNDGYEIFAIRHKSDFTNTKGINVLEGGLAAIDQKLINYLQPDMIFHLARPVLPRFRRWGRVMAAWQAAWLNRHLIAELRKTDMRPPLVFASGSLMYGNSSTPHDENAVRNPISYARQYVKGEMPIVDGLEKEIYPISIIRLPWLLGDGSWFRWFYLKNIHEKKAIPTFGDLANMMEIVDVSDAAKFMIRIAEANQPGIYNLPSGSAISQKDFAELIATVFSVEQLDYKFLIGNIEKEAFEAFTSNIMLKTIHTEIISQLVYTPIAKALERIKNSG